MTTSKTADDEGKELAKLVNASGFALQLAIENMVRTTRDLGWRVTSVEHPWRNPASNDEGFIDLVLQKLAVTWVVECKRPRAGSWVFLVPTGRHEPVKRVRCLWVAGEAGDAVAGWDDLSLFPESPESSYCVVRGTGESDRTLLERLSSIVTRSLDSLANEEIDPFKKSKQSYHGVYIPVIVTTAKLHICSFDPTAVSLVDGTVEPTAFSEVPFVRFRKALSPELPPGKYPDSLDSLAQVRERTVLVVSAGHLADLLRRALFDVNRVFGQKYPWEVQLERLASVRAAREAARHR